MNTTEDPAVERLLVPDMALTAAEYFAVEKNEKVLVLLTDMTSYADSLAIVSKIRLIKPLLLGLPFSINIFILRV